MILRKLTEQDAGRFQELILDMYNHLENLEWFSPMPTDFESIKDILSNPRFFVLGAFEKDDLLAVSSFDYKCGKLIGQNILPQDCTLENTVEIGFTMVKSNCQGKGIMKKLIIALEEIATKQNFKYIFGKVHIDNNASFRSFLSCVYTKYCEYEKTLKRDEFLSFIEKKILKPTTENKAKLTLQKDILSVRYAIYIKTLKK